MSDRCANCGSPLLGRIEGANLLVKCSELECGYQTSYTQATAPEDLQDAFKDEDTSNWQRLDLMG